MKEKPEYLFKDQNELFKQKTGFEYASVYKKQFPKLIYFISKITNDVQKSEDLAIDALMTALEKINQYDAEKAQLSTWIFTIARNLALQDKKMVNRNISIDIEYNEEGTTMKDFIHDNESDYYVYELKEKKANIMKAHISNLKEPYKSVIEMRELKRMSYKDISDQLGQNLSTIKSRIRNARIILMRETEPEFKYLETMFL